MKWFTAITLFIKCVLLVMEYLRGREQKQEALEELRDDLKERTDRAAAARKRPHDDSVQDKYQRD